MDKVQKFFFLEKILKITVLHYSCEAGDRSYQTLVDARVERACVMLELDLEDVALIFALCLSFHKSNLTDVREVQSTF